LTAAEHTAFSTNHLANINETKYDHNKTTQKPKHARQDNY